MLSKSIITGTLTACLLGFGTCNTALAIGEDVAQVRLINGWQAKDGSYMAAIHISMEEGWHTYWRNPGESGVPPVFDWSGSSNLASVVYEWPHPRIFETYGLSSIGYEDELVLPIRLVPVSTSEPIDASLSMFFGVCDEVCIPAQADIAPWTPSAGTEQNRAMIRTALDRGAKTAGEAGIVSVTCSLADHEGEISLTTEVTFASPLRENQVAVLELQQDGVFVGFPISTTRNNVVSASAQIAGLENTGLLLDRSAVQVTLLDGERTVVMEGCQSAG